MSDVLVLTGFPTLAPAAAPAGPPPGGAPVPADAARFASLLGAALQRRAPVTDLAPAQTAASPASDAMQAQSDAAHGVAVTGGFGAAAPAVEDDARSVTDVPGGSAETARVGAESPRVSAETPRVGVDSERVGAENARAGAENARIPADAAAGLNGRASAHASAAGAPGAIAAGAGREPVATESHAEASHELEPLPAQPAAATPARRADVTRPATRSLDALAPEFRVPLERVLARLEGEHGYQVEVLETYRSPERQQHLFEQGRTRPGPVVTWTRDSRHMQRLAADVQIRSTDGAAAYERLAVIAAEEGLRTLGARDPGHVELAAPRTTAPAPPLAPVSPSNDPARRVLTIARANGRAVPSADDVKQLAGEMMREAVSAARSGPAAAGFATRAPQRAGSASQSNGTAPHSGITAPGAAVMERESVRLPASRAEPQEAAPAAPARIEIDAPVLRPQPVDAGAAPAPANAAPEVDPALLRQRVERVVALQDAIAAQPAHSVLLRLDEGGDPLAQIRVGLRGGVVDTQLDVRDAGLAALLRADLPELQRALERRGLEAGVDPLRVFAAELVDAPAPPARTGGEGGSRFSGEPSSHHRHTGQQRQDGQPQRRDDGRQREEEEAS